MNAKTILSSVFIFATGAAIGSVVTWKILDTKYKQIIKEEIESVIDAFSRDANGEPQVTDESGTYEAPKASEVAGILFRNANGETTDGYASMLNELKNSKKEVDDVTEPYVISPDEYDENEDYDAETLFYYQDGVLTDDLDNPIENVEEIVGKDSLNRFGEFEDDSVFVRNDRLKTDYEILRDPSNFSDVTSGLLSAED